MRIPEPQTLMLDIEQCKAYNKHASNPVQLNDFIYAYKRMIGLTQGTVIDLGSGSCNFVIALARFFPDLKFVCYEASDAMLKIAKENIDSANLGSRIQLVKEDMMNATGTYDAVLANRVLHHVNDTAQFWKLISSLSENVLVVDINRPPIHVVENIRDNDYYAEAVYKEDLINSMQAAYSVEEVKEQVKIYNYEVISDAFYRMFVYHTR